MIRLTGNPVSQYQNNLYPKNGRGATIFFLEKRNETKKSLEKYSFWYLIQHLSNYTALIKELTIIQGAINLPSCRQFCC